MFGRGPDRDTSSHQGDPLSRHHSNHNWRRAWRRRHGDLQVSLMNTRIASASKPTVYVDEGQQEHLQQLAANSIAEGAPLLHRELERALVVRADEVPQQFVKLDSVVEFEDLLSAKFAPSLWFALRTPTSTGTRSRWSPR